MEFTEALDLGRHAFMTALMTATPILAIGLVVGLIISFFQAVTQLQEQTLTFVPKIAAMVVAAMFFIPWIATRMLHFTQEMFRF
ncbi:MAG TPA: flagellar biosynthesis protein FliQ [Phycisphaerae bacterium]|mgnify:CR=1 FL=1|nr:flagellar biosynthesis protein FliQ [Phycisphaerae bacterium]